jgi:predicted amidohydrolase
MIAAVLQLNSQGISSTKLYRYIRIASTKGVSLLVLGEYTLTPFFKELEHLSLDMINEALKVHTKVLRESARDYNMTIIAPLILIKNKKPYKVIAKFSPKSTSYYYQQFLINYPHWNEEKFFANEIAPLKAPLTFKVGNVRFGVISGYELHFDPLWQHVEEKNIDCMIIPSAATFGSYTRWEALIRTRAFTHNCYVLRANRIGAYKDKDIEWEFYGDSILASPDGEILNHLENNEELMIVSISHKEVVRTKKIWRFKEALKKRELLQQTKEHTL